MPKRPKESRERWDKQKSKKPLKNIHKTLKDLPSKVSTDYRKKKKAKATVKTALPLLDISKRVPIKPGIQLGKEFRVEDGIRNAPSRWDEHGKFESILERNSVKFVEKLKTFPITISKDYPYGARPHFNGVYLIYYTGQTSLYEGLVSPSQFQPIYVGKSGSDVLNRLKDHLKKVEKSKDLEVTDFVVRIMTVDIEFYECTIEQKLIKYYDPLWNNKEVKFSFGNGKDPKNNWYKYHVSKVKSKREEMIKSVENYTGLQQAFIITISWT